MRSAGTCFYLEQNSVLGGSSGRLPEGSLSHSPTALALQLPETAGAPGSGSGSWGSQACPSTAQSSPGSYRKGRGELIPLGLSQGRKHFRK